MVTEPVPVDFHRFRVLYSDGEVIDFIAARDDSTLRDHMLRTHWGAKGPGQNPAKGDRRRIAGVADLGLVSTHTPPTEFDDVAAEVADDG